MKARWNWAAARLRQWWYSRLAATDSVTLTQRNVYILPSASGLLLAITLLVLLLFSINEQLNLGYALTFLLTGCAAASVYIAHGTLRGLTLHLHTPTPQFAGAVTLLNITLSNSRSSTRQGVGVCLLGSKTDTQWAWVDIPAQGCSTVQLAYTPTQRGYNSLPLISAQTRFPMGAFRVWTLWRPAAQVLAYPRPETPAPALPLHAQSSPAGAHARMHTHVSDQAEGLRPYRRGDSLKQIAWKATAHSGTLVSRDRTPPQRAPLWLDLEHTGLPNLEERLSRLAAWVLQAESLTLDYGLVLPGQRIAPGHGTVHQRRCLSALALYSPRLGSAA